MSVRLLAVLGMGLLELVGEAEVGDEIEAMRWARRSLSFGRRSTGMGSPLKAVMVSMKVVWKRSLTRGSLAKRGDGGSLGRRRGFGAGGEAGPFISVGTTRWLGRDDSGAGVVTGSVPCWRLREGEMVGGSSVEDKTLRGDLRGDED